MIYSTDLVLQKTKMKREKIIQEYQPPQEKTKILNEQLRQEKLNNEELRMTFLKTVAYDMPKASKERVEATVYRKLYEIQHVTQEPEDPELTLKPRLNDTWKNEVFKKYYHNGKWG